MVLYHPYQLQIAYGAIAYQTCHGLIGSVVAQDMCNQNLGAGGTHQVEESFSVRQIGSQRFLAEHMYTGVQAVSQNAQMAVRVGGNDNDIKLRMIQKSMVVRAEMAGFITPGKGGGAFQILICHRDDMYIVPIIDFSDVLFTDVSAADQHDSILFFHENDHTFPQPANPGSRLK